MVGSVLSYLWSALAATLLQIAVVLGPGLVLAFIMNFEAGFVQRRILNIVGRGWYLGLFGWLGTSVHELGHAIFCLIFRHKITKMKLFAPDPETGTLGYVEHSYDSHSIYQQAGNYFIGIGPILLGIAVIYLLSVLLLGVNPSNAADNIKAAAGLNSWGTFVQLVQNIWTSSIHLLGQVFTWHNLSGWQFWVFIYLTFTIGNSITLSPPDIKSAFKGFIVILILIFLFNLVTVWMGDFTARFISATAGYLLVFYAVMFLIILLDIVAACLVILLLALMRKGQASTG